jgi:hypothetical protein
LAGKGNGNGGVRWVRNATREVRGCSQDEKAGHLIFQRWTALCNRKDGKFRVIVAVFKGE